MLQDREPLPQEEGDVTREYKAMHEENFLSSWLREDGNEKEERIMKIGKKTKEEIGEKRRREEEKENETRSVKMKMCPFLFLGGLQYIQSRVRSGDLWWSFLGGLLDLSDRESEVWMDVSVRMCVWCLM